MQLSPEYSELDLANAIRGDRLIFSSNDGGETISVTLLNKRSDRLGLRDSTHELGRDQLAVALGLRY